MKAKNAYRGANAKVSRGDGLIKKTPAISFLRPILFWGLAWGLFEATAGFALHLLPFSIGAYIWFPAAYLFMDRVYQKTGGKGAVLWVALLSAFLKLLNLFTSVRPDTVINPAVSILLESLAMVCVLSFARKSDGAVLSIASEVLLVNTLWRLGYTFYLGVLAPAWMREVSVVQSGAAFLTFFVKENLLSALVCVFAILTIGNFSKVRRQGLCLWIPPKGQCPFGSPDFASRQGREE